MSTLSWSALHDWWGSHSCGRKIKRTRVKVLNVGTWNVQTLLDNKKADTPKRRIAMVAIELGRYNVVIAALSGVSSATVREGYCSWGFNAKVGTDLQTWKVTLEDRELATAMATAFCSSRCVLPMTLSSPTHYSAFPPMTRHLGCTHALGTGM